MKSTGQSKTKSAPKKTAPKAAAKTTASPKGAAAKKASPKKTSPKTAATKKATPKVAAKAKTTPAKKPVASKPASKAKSPKAAVQAANDPRLDLLRLVEKSLDADKAENIVHVDLAEKSAIADFMVIATGRNTRQLAAMAQHVAEKLTKAGIKRISIEGLSQGDWVLVDGGDIIVHLFRPEIRTLYGLEKMWGINLPAPEALQAVG